MADTRTGLPPRFDTADPDLLHDVYSQYVGLREYGPLCRFVPGAWGVTRHAEVSRLLRRPELVKFFLPQAFFQDAVGSGPVADFFQQMDIGRSDPGVRETLAHEFSAASSRRRIEEIQAAAAAALEPVLEAGSAEVVTELARPLVLDVFCDVLGLPSAVRSAVAGWVSSLVNFGDISPTATRSVDEANVAVRHLREVVSAELAARDRSPRDDVLSRLAAVATGNDVRRRCADTVLALLYAGLETTANLIATGIAALADFPDQYAVLRAAPHDAHLAVEEFLRYDPPIQVTLRSVQAPIEIGGQVIRAGRTLALMLGCANRDERVFAEPARLDVRRRPNPHVSFGGGSFYCFGAAHARSNATAVFAELARRCASIGPAGEPERTAQFNFRSYTRLPVSLRPA